MDPATRSARWTLWLLLPFALAIAMIGWRLLQFDQLSNGFDGFGQAFWAAITRPYFRLGEMGVSPLFLVEVVVYLLLLGFASGAVDRILKERILTRTAMDSGQRYALARVSGYLVFAAGLAIGLQSIGLNLNTVTVFGGALGIGIGFGLQHLTNNFVSGLILLAERPIKVGDRVEVGDLVGDVMRIGARATWVRTNDNVIIILPNSEFTEQRVTNWTAHDRVIRFRVPLGVSYGSDPDQVRQILEQVARDNPDVLAEPAPDVIFVGFGDSSLDFELRVWTQNQVQTPNKLRSDLYFRIFAVFREHSIEIPFPQRDLHLRSSSLPWPGSGQGLSDGVSQPSA